MTDERDDVVATLESAEAEAPTPAAPAAEPDSTEAFLEELAALEADLEEQVTDDLDGVAKIEEAEKSGRLFDWPTLRGAKVKIAHFSAAIDAKARLEELYRKKKTLLPSVALPSKVEERLWEEAMFATVVLGWSGMKKGGYEMPFNLANYRFAMRLRRFRSFVLSKARDAQNFRDASTQELSGN